jgi:hypothetical protein
MTDCEIAADILQRTNDGRDLSQSPEEIERHGRNGDGQWLKFLEHAVNGFLNQRGKDLLRVFHQQVLAGDYQYSLRDFVARFCPEKGGA